jgi:mono/diheme cytochrome c family protein
MHRSFTKPFALLSVAALGALALVGCSSKGSSADADTVVVAATRPPAISGGTLMIARDGRAVAADSDRDRIWVVDLKAHALVSEIPLQPGDEPGRIVEDAQGRAHVVLRGGGGVATVDLTAGRVVARTPVCAAPRGIAYESARDLVHVACAGGELLSFAAGSGDLVRVLHLDADLRDVVVSGLGLIVSRFRSAEVLLLNDEGVLLNRLRPETFVTSDATQMFDPTVAWRMIPLPTGGVAIVHERSLTTEIVLGPGSYAGTGCSNGVVAGSLTVLDNAALGGAYVPPTPILARTILPVDVAAIQDPTDTRFAIVTAGNDKLIQTSASGMAAEVGSGTCSQAATTTDLAGQPVSIAAAGAQFVVQMREPAALLVLDGSAPIYLAPNWSVDDTGHDLFHRNDGGTTSLACASCHPEGRDDGQVWNFFPTGPRRTPNIGGGLLSTAPFHWDGDLADMDAIMDEVFMKRMGGVLQGPLRVAAFGDWLDGQPSFPAESSASADSIAHGSVLFNDPELQCVTCHSGPKLTNNATVDVGTGKAFQVPSLLGLSGRAPYLHDGRAATLQDRFTALGGGESHGHTAQLTPGDLNDLIAFLGTL